MLLATFENISCSQVKGKEKQFVFNSLFNRKPVKSVKDRRYVIKLRSSTDEPCSIVLNFLKFKLNFLNFLKQELLQQQQQPCVNREGYIQPKTKFIKMKVKVDILLIIFIILYLVPDTFSLLPLSAVVISIEHIL